MDLFRRADFVGWEELEKKCWSSLMLIKDLKVLEEICTALEIQPPHNNVDKTNLLF